MNLSSFLERLAARIDVRARADVDSAESAFRLRMAVLLLPTLLAGAFAGGFVAARAGIPLVIGLLLGPPLFYLLCYLAAVLIISAAGRGASTLHAPSGSSTPLPPQYSYPESLAARGRFREAVRAFEECLAEQPEEPEPCLRIARLLRDRLSAHEEAVQWFRRARALPRLEPGKQMLVGREIVELYIHKLKRPAAAAPELARLAEQFRGTPTGDWARATLGQVKQEMREANN